jgi:hypothetical protein
MQRARALAWCRLLRIAGRGETVTLGDFATLRVDALHVGVAEGRKDEVRLAAERPSG